MRVAGAAVTRGISTREVLAEIGHPQKLELERKSWLSRPTMRLLTL
jgi:hypothetical protein